MLETIRQKVSENERLSEAEGMFLLTEASLLDLGHLARAARRRHNTSQMVTYVEDTNLNYTNICNAYCSFCAFYRTDRNDPSAYTYTVEQMMDKIGRAHKKGITTVLMQGGLNDELPMDYYTEMVSECRRLYPGVTPHFWSAPEIWMMCEVAKATPVEVFRMLWDAGQRSMPGGGAEILSNYARAETSRFHPKDTWDKWTTIHEAAHEVGFKTTATMMYGHIERDQDIVESFLHIRDTQDKALARDNGSGFTAFIPWSYKRDNTALAAKVKTEAKANRYLRIIALSRLMLDNVEHIQASWFSEGRKVGQVALQFGADDFGGTLYDENVMLSAGFYNRTTADEVRKLISDSGFIPAQRHTDYTVVKVFEAMGVE